VRGRDAGVQYDRRKQEIIDEDAVRPSSASVRRRSPTTSVWWATLAAQGELDEAMSAFFTSGARGRRRTASGPVVDLHRLADRLQRVGAHPVERVDGDDERHAARLEVVDRGEAVAEPAGVGEDHRADGAAGELVPHEVEPLLAGRAEQVQHDLGVSAMRPKSIATVVVCLVPICAEVVDVAEAVVIIASDRSGSISEIVFTKVDLPTPKPPATTILTGILVGAGGAEVRGCGHRRAPFPTGW
jgi:hypothetical protein